MTWIADAGLWVAIVLAGLATGTLAARWKENGGALPRATEGFLFAAAAAAVVAWCSHAGALLGGSSSAFGRAVLPIEAAAGYRLAILWATLPGAALTLAMILLVRTALGGVSVRAACLTSSLSLAALGAFAWFVPRDSSPTAIPPFAQATAAAIAPFFALLAIVVLALVVATAVGRAKEPPRVLLLVAWLFATAALVSEQAARSQLGIGPRDAIVLGSASSGLVLWLLTAAFLHRRVQSLLFRWPHSTGSMARYPAMTAHVGAALLATSFAAHAFASRSTIPLSPGQSVPVTDAFRREWQLVNQGLSRYDEEGAVVTALAVEARAPGGKVALMTPEIRELHGREGQHLEAPVSVRRSAGSTTQVLRILLVGADSLDVAHVRVTFLPVPILWPIGVALLALSFLLALAAPPSRGPAS